MTWAGELGTLESYFNTNWSTTPIQFENVKFDVPANQAEYVRFRVLPGNSQLAGYRGGTGQGLWRHFGIVQIDIYVPIGAGTKRGLELADMVSALFRGKRISDVLIRDLSIAKPQSEQGYFRVVLTCGYQRDSIL